jgi:hypothetical protein
MRVTLTGATGFIGNRLLKRLLAEGHSVHLLVRSARTGLPPGVERSIWNTLEGDPPAASLAQADAVIHLAGEPVAQRWTPDAKRRIRDSRVEGTRRLVGVLAGLERRPAAMVCASAIGYYGIRGEEALDETSAPGSGFLPEVCIEWEKAADAAAALGLRVVKLRTGVALGPEGGALARMLPPFRLGAGGRLGSGKQWMSWIHVDDLVSLFLFALEGAGVRGPLNATAPNPVRNSDFTEKLAAVLRRPALVPVPAFAIRLLFGEMSEVVLGSQRVLPRAGEAAGFRFRYPEVLPALRQLLG